MSKQIRILIAKPGLDGHDRGAKTVAYALREAGMEVIYTGLHQTAEQIAKAAMEEDVDVIALSILSGAHLPLCKQILQTMKKAGLTKTPVVLGGVIPATDIPVLKKIGIRAVLPTGTRFEEIIETIQTLAKKLQ